jgi:hypothetical protein
MMLNKSPKPTAIGACSFAIAVHVAGRRWLSFLRWQKQLMTGATYWCPKWPKFWGLRRRPHKSHSSHASQTSHSPNSAARVWTMGPMGCMGLMRPMGRAAGNHEPITGKIVKANKPMLTTASTPRKRRRDWDESMVADSFNHPSHPRHHQGRCPWLRCRRAFSAPKSKLFQMALN